MHLTTTPSERIDLLRYPLILGVVFIHAYASAVTLAGTTIGAETVSPGADLARQLISQELARVAVPLYFSIAGYLFFLTFDGSWQGYRAKLTTRVRSLLVPFLFWNGVTLALYATAQAIPPLAGFFSGKDRPIASYTWFDYLDALFGVTGSPIAYQFWFVRDLMLLVVAAPLLLWLIRALPRATLAVLLLVWLFDRNMLLRPSEEALCFFYAGALFGARRSALAPLDRYGPALLLGFAVLIAADLALPDQGLGKAEHRLTIGVGAMSAWYAMGLAANAEWARRGLLGLAPATFFVFAAHEPLLIATRKLLYRLLQPESDAMILLVYLGSVAGVATLCTASYFLLRRLFPQTISLITGGRDRSFTEVCNAQVGYPASDCDGR